MGGRWFYTSVPLYFVNGFTIISPVDFGLENGSSMPAMISFTKSPNTSKTKKKGFFQKVFKKKSRKDKSPETSRKAKNASMEISPADLTAEERDKLMRHYTLQHTRSHTNSSGSRALELQFSSLPSNNHRHSLSVLDDYDSPGSPDEILLASMARV